MAVRPEDLARTLMRRHAEERRRAAARAHVLRSELAEVVRQELSGDQFQRAWLVGSLAWGRFGRRSDVDLVVEGLPEAESPALWDRLSSKLGARVDLMRLESLPASFAERVRTEGTPLHVT